MRGARDFAFCHTSSAWAPFFDAFRWRHGACHSLFSDSPSGGNTPVGARHLKFRTSVRSLTARLPITVVERYTWNRTEEIKPDSAICQAQNQPEWQTLCLHVALGHSVWQQPEPSRECFLASVSMQRLQVSQARTLLLCR